MKTLYLLRHAKSSWAEPGQPDRERPLKARGCTDAALVAQHMARRGPMPEAIFCSPARRARQTAEIVAAALGGAPAVVVEALYGCVASGLFEIVRGLPDDLDTVLLVGHNPTFHEAALALAGKEGGESWRRLVQKFPTAALATLALDAPSWRDIRPGAFRLADYATPRLLKGDATDG